jgi:subtilisin family serine protease
MEVIVNRLNRRRSPVTDFRNKSNIVDVVNKGARFESVNEIENMLGKWYKDQDGFFYWSAGVKIIDSPSNISVPTTDALVNYQQAFEALKSTWFEKKGRGVKIAVLDTGFFLDHPDLSHLKGKAVIKDFGGNGNTIDKEGHGTHVLGLLAADSVSKQGIIGMAPAADYFLYKVVRDQLGFIDSFATAAIEECIQNNVDVINLSFNVPSSAGSSLDTAIQKAINNKILLVAAAGENADLVQQSLVFPSQFSGVISTGVVDRNFISHSDLKFNSMLDLMMPFRNFRSCWFNDASGFYKEEKGSSMATALASGILASILTTNINKENALNELRNSIPTFSTQQFEDEKIKIYKV